MLIFEAQAQHKNTIGLAQICLSFLKFDEGVSIGLLLWQTWFSEKSNKTWLLGKLNQHNFLTNFTYHSCPRPVYLVLKYYLSVWFAIHKLTPCYGINTVESVILVEKKWL